MITITPSHDLRDLIHRSGRMNCHLSAIFPAIDAGLTLAVITKRDAPVSMTKLRAVRGPVLALLGDDDYHATGPEKWTSAQNLIRWAEAVMIHAAGAEHAHYREAAAAAIMTGRLLLVETDSAHAQAWVEAAGVKTRLVIIPRNGPHPVTPSREAMH